MSGAGWRSRAERELVGWAAERGWRVRGRNGMGHLTLEWPATGARVPVASHPQGRASANAKAQLRRTEERGSSRQ